MSYRMLWLRVKLVKVEAEKTYIGAVDGGLINRLLIKAKVRKPAAATAEAKS